MKDLVYKVGCIIEAGKNGDINVLIQQNNCFCTRKSGIAPLIDKAFGVGYADDMTTKGGKFKLGTYVVEHSPLYENLIVVFMYSQYDYGRQKKQYTDYLAMKVSLSRWAYENKEHKETDIIGIPYGMGCGLGGGEWNIVEQIIKDTLCYYDYNVVIYKLENTK